MELRSLYSEVVMNISARSGVELLAKWTAGTLEQGLCILQGLAVGQGTAAWDLLSASWGKPTSVVLSV